MTGAIMGEPPHGELAGVSHGGSGQIGKRKLESGKEKEGVKDAAGNHVRIPPTAKEANDVLYYSIETTHETKKDIMHAKVRSKVIWMNCLVATLLAMTCSYKLLFFLVLLVQATIFNYYN